MVINNLYWKKHCHLVVGTYCEVHNKSDPSNTMTTRTHREIALGLTGNLNGTNKFFCLKTERILKRWKWTEYHMPQQVINTVNKCGGKPKKTEYGANLEFRNHTRDILIGKLKMSYMTY